MLYGVAALGFFLVAGVMALLIRAELAVPGLQLVSEQTYSGLFTMHGTAMMLLFATPMVAAFAVLVPLQIGAADMVFPRLNALSFWLFLFGGIIVLSGFLVASGPADVGWTGYAPNSSIPYSTTTGTDLWIVGLLLTGVASVFGAVNFALTIFTARARDVAAPDAGVLVDDPRDSGADPVRVPGHHRGPDHAAARAAVRGPRSSIPRPVATRSCGSTCSGSSATPRCTSSRCRSSA